MVLLELLCPLEWECEDVFDYAYFECSFCCAACSLSLLCDLIIETCLFQQFRVSCQLLLLVVKNTLFDLKLCSVYNVNILNDLDIEYKTT